MKTHIWQLFIAICLIVAVTPAQADGGRKIDKIHQWWDTKVHNRAANSAEQIGNLQVESGKARLRAEKAKARLDKHNAECENTKQYLEADYLRELGRAENLEEQLRNSLR